MSYPAPLDHTAPVAVPSRVGQATAVEQSRAVAEVQAAVIVAQQCPRSVAVARTEMQASCDQMGLAERAFFRFARGGNNVSGASVHLARELARCWGNVQYGINELRRDDVAGESEMQAWAWDVQTNSRSSSTFIVPHKRDKKGGPERLTDLRDIYENNANMGARRLREAIFSILPPWFTEEAKERCARTIEHGGGRPLPERIEGAVRTFERIGVTVDRLEQKLGRDRDRWTQYDIAQLIVTHRSIERGEVTIEDEFPPRRVTVDEITAPTAPTAPEPPAAAATAEPVDAQEPAAEPEPVAEPEPAPAQDATPGPMAATKQLNKLAAEFNRLGWTDEQIDAHLLDATGGRTSSRKDLTAAEASTAIERLPF